MPKFRIELETNEKFNGVITADSYQEATDKAIAIFMDEYIDIHCNEIKEAE